MPHPCLTFDDQWRKSSKFAGNEAQLIPLTGQGMLQAVSDQVAQFRTEIQDFEKLFWIGQVKHAVFDKPIGNG